MRTTKNYLYNITYNVLNISLPLITAPYLARIFGSEGVGIISYYFAIAQFFALIAKLGLTNYGTRIISEVRDDEKLLRKTFSSIYWMQIVVTLFIAIMYFGYAILFVHSLKIIFYIFGIWIISVTFDVDWFLFGIEDYKRAAIRSCVVKVLAAISIFTIVKLVDDLWKYALITALSYLLGYIYLWISSKKYLCLKQVKFKEVIIHLRPCLLLMVPVLALNIYRSMDKVMLGSMSTMNETGLYENAEKIIYCLCTFISSLGTVMMPKMTNLLAKGEKNKSIEYMEYSMLFIIFLASGMCFGLISIADSIVPLLFGSEFYGSIILVCLLAVTMIFIAWGNVIRTQYAIPNKKDNIYIGSILCGAIINILVNVILIKNLGAVGACIGTIAAELSVPIYLAIKIKKEIPYLRYLKITVPFIGIGLFMCIILKIVEFVFSAGTMTMILQMIIGAVVYMTLSFVYLNIKKPGIVSKVWQKNVA